MDAEACMAHGTGAERGVSNNARSMVDLCNRAHQSLREPPLLAVRQIAALLLGQRLAIEPVRLPRDGGL